MATITRDITLDVSPENAWRRIADVGAVNELIDFVGEVTLEGDHRSCALGDGGTLEELIVSIDSDRRRLVYSIRQSPFEFEHHSASMQAVPDGDGRTRFVWVTDFKPDAVAAALEGVIDQAVESIKRVLD
jgi:carbon monoxide dehydrogenase subunit G